MVSAGCRWSRVRPRGSGEALRLQVVVLDGVHGRCEEKVGVKEREGVRRIGESARDSLRRIGEWLREHGRDEGFRGLRLVSRDL